MPDGSTEFVSGTRRRSENSSCSVTQQSRSTNRHHRVHFYPQQISAKSQLTQASPPNRQKRYEYRRRQSIVKDNHQTHSQWVSSQCRSKAASNTERLSYSRRDGTTTTVRLFAAGGGAIVSTHIYRYTGTSTGTREEGQAQRQCKEDANNDNLCKYLMYHAACKVEFQPFTW